MATYTLIPFNPLTFNDPALWPVGTKMQGTAFTLNDGDILLVDPTSITPSNYATTFINAGTGTFPVDYEIQVSGVLAGSAFYNLYAFVFGANTNPLVSLADGTDASALYLSGLNASGVQVEGGINTQLGTVYTGNGTGGTTSSITLGDGSRIYAIDAMRAGDVTLSFGNNVTVESFIWSFDPALPTSSGGAFTFTAGDNLIVGGSVVLNPNSGDSASISVGTDAEFKLPIFSYGEDDSFIAGPSLQSNTIHLEASNSNTIDIGVGSTISGYVAALNGDSIVNIGSGSTITSYIHTQPYAVNGNTDSTITIGDNVSVAYIDQNGANMVFSAGDDFVSGPLFLTEFGATLNASIGNDAVINGGAFFGTTNMTANVVVGDNYSSISGVYVHTIGGAGTFTAGSGFNATVVEGGDLSNDQFRLGDNWTLSGNIFNSFGGNDSLFLGSTTDTAGLNFIYGGESFGDNDVLMLKLSPAQEASFAAAATAAGWTVNPDGSWKSENSGGVNLPLTWNGQYFSFWEKVRAVPCFVRGTSIMTSHGEAFVQDLRVGEEVLTLDGGYKKIRWIGCTALSSLDLQENPKLRPIAIMAHALGAGVPARDLFVSPQHRILIDSEVAEEIAGEREVLVAAKHLLALDGVRQVNEDVGVEYWHFLLDDHQVVFANGAASESLYTGPEAMKALSYEARQEIFSLLPELRSIDLDALPPPARSVVSGRQGRMLAELIQATQVAPQRVLHG